MSTSESLSDFPAIPDVSVDPPGTPDDSATSRPPPRPVIDVKTAKFYRPSAFAHVPSRADVPNGYVPFAPAGRSDVRSSRGFGTLTIVVFWIVTGLGGLLSLAYFARKSTWDDFQSGSATLEDLRNADRSVTVAALLVLAAQLVAAVTVCLWSLRIAKNAKARGEWNVSLGMAVAGWLIPIGWFWLGFSQVRVSVEGVGGRSAYLRSWQRAFLFVSVAALVARVVGGSTSLAVSRSAVASTLQWQGIVAVISMLTLALASFYAMRAIREIDDVVSVRPI